MAFTPLLSPLHGHTILTRNLYPHILPLPLWPQATQARATSSTPASSSGVRTTSSLSALMPRIPMDGTACAVRRHTHTRARVRTQTYRHVDYVCRYSYMHYLYPHTCVYIMQLQPLARAQTPDINAFGHRHLCTLTNTHMPTCTRARTGIVHICTCTHMYIILF